MFHVGDEIPARVDSGTPTEPLPDHLHRPWTLRACLSRPATGKCDLLNSRPKASRQGSQQHTPKRTVSDSVHSDALRADVDKPAKRFRRRTFRGSASSSAGACRSVDVNSEAVAQLSFSAPSDLLSVRAFPSACCLSLPSIVTEAFLYGSAGSGIDVPVMVLPDLLDVPMCYRLAIERVTSARQFLSRNFRCCTVGIDVLRWSTRRIDVRLHLFLASPPCQSLAPGGKGLAEHDFRVKAFYASVDFICRNLPLTFCLENSEMLLGKRGQVILRYILRRLRACGYTLSCGKLATHRHGLLPHFRIRAFVLGVHVDAPGGCRKIAFPLDVAALAPAAVLDPRSADDDPLRLPSTPSAALSVQCARERFAALGQAKRSAFSSDWFCSVHHSSSWRPNVRPRALLPSMLYSHPEGPWIVSRGRFLRDEEYARFQGIDFKAWHWPTPTFARKACGNALTAPLIARILRPLVMASTGRPTVSDDQLLGLWRKRLGEWAGSSACVQGSDLAVTLARWFASSSSGSLS